MQRSDEVLIVAQPHEYLRTLGIHVVAQVGGVNTRIGGHLLLVERLHGLQRHIHGYAELLVTFRLQLTQVKQRLGQLPALLLGYSGHGEGCPLYAVEYGLPLLLAGDGLHARVLGIGLSPCFVHIEG